MMRRARTVSGLESGRNQTPCASGGCFFWNSTKPLVVRPGLPIKNSVRLLTCTWQVRPLDVRLKMTPPASCPLCWLSREPSKSVILAFRHTLRSRVGRLPRCDRKCKYGRPGRTRTIDPIVSRQRRPITCRHPYCRQRTLTHPEKPYQGKPENPGVQVPPVRMECGFRAHQRLNKGTLVSSALGEGASPSCRVLSAMGKAKRGSLVPGYSPTTLVGVRSPSTLWGRWWLSWYRRAASFCRVSSRDRNHSTFKHSFRQRPLKLSMKPFSIGRPVRMKINCTPCSIAQASKTRPANSLPSARPHSTGRTSATRFGNFPHGMEPLGPSYGIPSGRTSEGSASAGSSAVVLCLFPKR